MRNVNRIATAVAALCALWGAGAAHAAIVYVGDDFGNVGRFDTETNTGSALGRLPGSGGTASIATGLAYDPATDSVLIMSSNNQTVYAMDATSGLFKSTFSTPGVDFAGGAVLDGMVYGFDLRVAFSESKALAYSLEGVAQGLSGPHLGFLWRAMGVDPSAGRLYSGSMFGGDIYRLNADGTAGELAVANVDAITLIDLDYFEGDFLVAAVNDVRLIDGATGAGSVFLDRAQLNAMGVTGYVNGVAVQYEAAPVPEPSSLALAGLGGLGLLASRARRRPKPA